MQSHCDDDADVAAEVLMNSRVVGTCFISAPTVIATSPPEYQNNVPTVAGLLRPVSSGNHLDQSRHLVRRRPIWLQTTSDNERLTNYSPPATTKFIIERGDIHSSFIHTNCDD